MWNASLAIEQLPLTLQRQLSLMRQLDEQTLGEESKFACSILLLTLFISVERSTSANFAKVYQAAPDFGWYIQS